MKKLVYIFFLFSCSCTNGPQLSVKDYILWVDNKNNGLISTQEINEFSYELKYKPWEYIACMEIKKHEVSENDMTIKKKELSGLEYFTLTIKNSRNSGVLFNESSSKEQDMLRMDYLFMYMQDDLALITKNDTIPCVLYHMEHGANVNQDIKIVLAFERRQENKAEPITVLLDEKILVNKKISFYYPEEVFENIPSLKIN